MCKAIADIAGRANRIVDSYRTRMAEGSPLLFDDQGQALHPQLMTGLNIRCQRWTNAFRHYLRILQYVEDFTPPGVQLTPQLAQKLSFAVDQLATAEAEFSVELAEVLAGLPV